ncbi:hydroxypyruvate isomerase [Caballeronia udeis]|uniref:Hydroxypyruvate isomerase n=1 Tax=Caballeronia udeis TaxID=1232866 RepID=A0A158JZ96_9BURK|nr:TIM barrel protein [Caballeronia udeis]SAL74065.1 hydroxypyruvate isomerase [Caballeronia udeis]
MKLSAHLGFQFNEVPFLARFADAAKAGYKGVEFPSPYNHDPAVLKEELDRNGLHLVQIAAPMGNSQAGDKGMTPFPVRVEEYKRSIQTALNNAVYLGCPRIHVMAGIVAREADASWAVYVANLRAAVELFSASGITTLVEVMSPRGMPNFYLSSFELAERLFNEITDPNLQVLIDTYHVASLGLDVVATLKEWLPKTGHIQIADYPDRHEPGTGSLPFGAIFNAVAAFGYDQWIGCEYHPLGDTVSGLRYLAPYLANSEVLLRPGYCPQHRDP